MQRTRRLIQKGFTLVELLIVIIIIGIIAAIVIPRIGQSSTDTANSKTLFQTANVMAQNWQLINTQCNTNSGIGASTGPLTTSSSANALALLVEGDTSKLVATKTDCYNASSVKAMNSIVKNGANYQFQGYDITLSGGGSVPLKVSFAAVPTSFVQVVYSQYAVNGTAWATGTADTTDRRIQHSADSSGTMTLDILVNI